MQPHKSYLRGFLFSDIMNTNATYIQKTRGGTKNEQHKLPFPNFATAHIQSNTTNPIDVSTTTRECVFNQLAA